MVPPMKLKIEAYLAHEDAYQCKDKQGRQHLVDFHIDGSSKIKKYPDRKTLIGKTITIDYLWPFLELASNVSKIED